MQFRAFRRFAENETASEPYIVQVPLIGKVAAGEPLLAVEHIDGYFPMPLDRLPNAETFLLKVQGESMVNAGNSEWRLRSCGTAGNRQQRGNGRLRFLRIPPQ